MGKKYRKTCSTSITAPRQYDRTQPKRFNGEKALRTIKLYESPHLAEDKTIGTSFMYQLPVLRIKSTRSQNTALVPSLLKRPTAPLKKRRKPLVSLPGLFPLPKRKPMLKVTGI
jgi:hypothetical protein